jgi:hypothetical protein
MTRQPHFSYRGKWGCLVLMVCAEAKWRTSDSSSATEALHIRGRRCRNWVECANPVASGRYNCPGNTPFKIASRPHFRSTALPADHWGPLLLMFNAPQLTIKFRRAMVCRPAEQMQMILGRNRRLLTKIGGYYFNPALPGRLFPQLSACRGQLPLRECGRLLGRERGPTNHPRDC